MWRHDHAAATGDRHRQDEPPPPASNTKRIEHGPVGQPRLRYLSNNASIWTLGLGHPEKLRFARYQQWSLPFVPAYPPKHSRNGLLILKTTRLFQSRLSGAHGLGGRGDTPTRLQPYFAKLTTPKSSLPTASKSHRWSKTYRNINLPINIVFHWRQRPLPARMRAYAMTQKQQQRWKDDPKYTTAIQQIPIWVRTCDGFSYGTGFDWRLRHLHLLQNTAPFPRIDFGWNLAVVPTPRFHQSQLKPESRKSQKLGNWVRQRQSGQLASLA